MVPATAVALAVSLAVAACGAGSPPRAVNGTPVISTVSAENQYASVLSQIGGRYVHVTSVLDNPNADPHTFEISPQLARVVGSAQLVVQNGAGYDSWMNRIEAATPNPSRKVITVAQVLRLPASTPNPHLWYDPATMPAVARVIAAGLSALQPAHRAYFQANLAAFSASLAPLRTAIAQFKAAHPGTKAATTEPVADYLLTAMGIRNLTPYRLQADVMNGIDPAPQDIDLENSLFTGHRVQLFAYNQQVTSALTLSIRQNALRAGVPVVAVYETMPAGHTYQSWMLAEVKAIQQAVTSGISTQRL